MTDKTLSAAALQDVLARLKAETGEGSDTERLEAARYLADLPPPAPLLAAEAAVDSLTKSLAAIRTDAASERAIRAAVHDWRAKHEDEARALFNKPPGPVAAIIGTTPPAPCLLWNAAPHWPVVSVGEVGLLSGPGDSGKSYLTLQWGVSAARAGDGGYGVAAGFRVRGGPVVLVSFEDNTARLAHKVSAIAGGDANVPADLHFLPEPEPLYRVEGDRALPAEGWSVLWDYVREIGARLVIIDPVAEAFPDCSPAITGQARAFVNALSRASAKHDCGVLLVAHDSKAARQRTREGAEPGADAIAGSGGWYDRSRGVLYMHTDKAEPSRRILECVKCNSGRKHWGVRIAPAHGGAVGEAFAGWRHTGDIQPADMTEAKSGVLTAAEGTNATGYRAAVARMEANAKQHPATGTHLSADESAAVLAALRAGGGEADTDWNTPL